MALIQQEKGRGKCRRRLRPNHLLPLCAAALTAAGCQLIAGLGGEAPLEERRDDSGESVPISAAAQKIGCFPETPGCGLWMRALRGEAHGLSMAASGAGDIVVAAQIAGKVDLGDGRPLGPMGTGDAVLLKYDGDGNLLWKKLVSGPEYQVLHHVGSDPAGAVVLTGESYGPTTLGQITLPQGAFIAKLDPDGAVLWVRQAHGAGGALRLHFAEIDPKGDVVVAGNTPSIDLGTGTFASGDGESFFLAKLDGETGAPRWIKITRGGGSETVKGLKLDPEGRIVLTGDLAGDRLGLGSGVPAPPDIENPCRGPAPFLAWLTPEGDFIEARMLPVHCDWGEASTTRFTINDLDVDPHGAVTLAGSFTGHITLASGIWTSAEATTTGIVVRDGLDLPQWSYAHIGPPQAVTDFQNVSADGAGNLLITGTYSGAVSFGERVLPARGSVLVLRLNGDGELLWQNSYHFGGGTLLEAALDRHGEALVLGDFSGTANLGRDRVDARQGVFLGKLGN